MPLLKLQRQHLPESSPTTCTKSLNPTKATTATTTTTMTDAKPPAKRFKHDFSDHIHVLVGPSKHDFVVHKGLVTKRSSFFKAAMAQRAWMNSKDGAQTVRLPDDKPAVFAYYLQCLYTNTTPEIIRDTDDIASIFDLYILAEKLGDPASANTIIDAIITASDEEDFIPPLSCVSYAWKKTVPGSNLRKLLMDYYLHEVNEEFLATAKAESIDIKEFLFEVLRSFVKDRVGATAEATVKATFGKLISERPECYYHKHDDLCPPCTSE
ncbi:hypothetical protein LTR27_001303 [Elasticomyces elasticus]|nr:hypothetical protein LTR27_001303 [Elasticomyces elasticus]